MAVAVLGVRTLEYLVSVGTLNTTIPTFGWRAVNMLNKPAIFLDINSSQPPTTRLSVVFCLVNGIWNECGCNL